MRLCRRWQERTAKSAVNAFSSPAFKLPKEGQADHAIHTAKLFDRTKLLAPVTFKMNDVHFDPYRMTSTTGLLTSTSMPRRGSGSIVRSAFKCIIQIGCDRNDGPVQQGHPFTRLELPAPPRKIAANRVGDFLVYCQFAHSPFSGPRIPNSLEILYYGMTR